MEFVYNPSPRVMFYLMFIYVAIVIIGTVAWCVALFLEVTRKRASKLSMKYGSAKQQNNKGKVVKLVIQGLVLVMAWVFFLTSDWKGV